MNPEPVSADDSRVPEVAATEGPAKPSANETPEVIDLSSGRELAESSALVLAESRPVRWIVIAGQVSSGKTTLLTSLYELFQWGLIDDCRFAGSQTLAAFEERCHYSRLASERVTPDTPRTPYSPIANYLHLRLQPANEIPVSVDFLFTDVSGEMFEHARNSTDDCKELVFLKRAASFILVLDGEKAVRPDRRWAMVEEAKSLLKSCLDSSMLSENCRVVVVWSKIDYFGDGTNADLEKFRTEVHDIFRKTFGNRVAHLDFADVSARPTKAPGLGFGKGIPQLLKRWIHDYSQNEPLQLSPTPAHGIRESELFAIRETAEINP